MKTISKGSTCYIGNDEFIVEQIMSFESVLLKPVRGGDFKLAKRNEISFSQDHPDTVYLEQLSDEDYNLAIKRLEIIRPILEMEKSRSFITNKTEFIESIAKTNNMGVTTIYRWLDKYRSTELLSSLLPQKTSGGLGTHRLDEKVQEIITKTINEKYLNSNKWSKHNVIEEVFRLCYLQKIKPPHKNTILNWIAKVDPKVGLKKRYGAKEIDATVSATPGSYKDATHPLSVVQIDHALLDIEVLSEDTREPIGRPWITMAIDVYSRMVTGFYVSMDSPGSLGTGICISNSILPKDKICAKYNLKCDWPIFGVMNSIHLDNAREFRGNMLTRACSEYNISLLWRPVAQPWYGGYIERIFGTFAKKIHVLPGTTFANVKAKGKYKSKKKAVFTLSELEEWLTVQIVEIYHNSRHSSIKSTPYEMYCSAILGLNGQKSIGLPILEIPEKKIKLDFLPYFERTIQRSGVLIDHIYYYSELFNSFLHRRAWKASNDSVKNAIAEKYIFKRDPRDISKIFFLNPDTKDYVDVHYADITKPPISIWEHRAALAKAEELFPHTKMNEDLIFEALTRLKELENNAAKMKSTAKRKERAKKVKEFLDEKEIEDDLNTIENENYISFDNNSDFDFEPFEIDTDI